MVTITQALERVKDDFPHDLDANRIDQACRDVGHRWRDRVLNPVTTIYTFLVQILYGNTACNHLPHLVGQSFTGSAYSQARKRLPLAVLQTLLRALVESAQRASTKVGLWRGHRTFIVDASTCLMPDNEQLDGHFGRPPNHNPGCGFPMAHLLMLFDSATGMIVSLIASKRYTGDLKHITRMHPHLQPNDLLIGDRAFGLYVHLALLLQGKMHGLFRLHQTINVGFTPHRPYRHPSVIAKARHKGWPSSRWIKSLGRNDQLVEYHQPKRRSTVIDARTHDTLAKSIVVRELRYTVKRSGFRVRHITLVTTLLDPKKYPAEVLITLYQSRWQVETNLRHLKTSMGMTQLKCKTIDGVMKELTTFVLVYNLVRVVMLESARRQRVKPDRISFMDALRWLICDQSPLTLAQLTVNPSRPGRVEPRQLKRQPKHYTSMKKPRHVLRQELLRKQDTV